METLQGAEDEFGHARLGGIGQLLEREIESRTGYESRATVLGHIQRGGTPTAFEPRCSPPAWAWPRWTRPTRGAGA